MKMKNPIAFLYRLFAPQPPIPVGGAGVLHIDEEGYIQVWCPILRTYFNVGLSSDLQDEVDITNPSVTFTYANGRVTLRV
jgi:hypothetical protein